MRNSELEKRGFLIEGDGEEGDWELPVWSGKAPKTGAWVAPHRQVEQVASEEVKKVCRSSCLFVFEREREREREVFSYGWHRSRKKDP